MPYSPRVFYKNGAARLVTTSAGEVDLLAAGWKRGEQADTNADEPSLGFDPASIGTGGGGTTGGVTPADLADAVALLQDRATAATDSELAAAVATINTALAGKQAAATAATDAELASAVALLQDKATAATDAELAAAVATLQSAATAATDAELAAAVDTINTALAAETAARLAATPSPVETVNTVAASGAAQTLPDVTTATIHSVTLTANCTFTFPAAAAGKSFTLRLVQDTTGSRTATWPASVKWPSAVPPVLSTGAGKIDYVTFICADGVNWAGFLGGLDFR